MRSITTPRSRSTWASTVPGPCWPARWRRPAPRPKEPMQAAIDLHSHLMPGVDDGAVDAAEALAGVQALRDAGVATAVTTPHMAASVTADPVRFQASMAELDAAWARLEQLASGSGLELERGVELLLDSPSFELDDPRVRLAGG